MAMNFGQRGNACSCGKHSGIGDWSPEERAANYARIRAEIPTIYDENRKAYLESWEEKHGRAEYTMVFSHLASKDAAKKFGIHDGKEVFKPMLVGHEQSVSAQRNWYQE